MKTIHIFHPVSIGAPFVSTMLPQPPVLIPESELQVPCLLHHAGQQATYECQSFTRMPITQMHDALSYAICGQPAADLLEAFHRNYPSAPGTPTVAIYAWKKI